MFHEPDTFCSEPAVPMLSGGAVVADPLADSTGSVGGAELGAVSETGRACGAAVLRAGAASPGTVFVASECLDSASPPPCVGGFIGASVWLVF